MYVKIDDERFIVDMMYARENNMVGRAAYVETGWGNLAVVHQDLWERLQKIIPTLKNNGLKMKICDAYRPPKAHDLMKTLIPMDGFFAANAARSQHCHATAVDVCLCDENGNELLYPTPVDAYHLQFAREVARGEDSNFKKYLVKARHDFNEGIPSEALANREFLRKLMENAGFESIVHEWWHYDLPNGRSDKYPMIDLKPEDF